MKRSGVVLKMTPTHPTQRSPQAGATVVIHLFLEAPYTVSAQSGGTHGCDGVLRDLFATIYVQTPCNRDQQKASSSVHLTSMLLVGLGNSSLCTFYTTVYLTTNTRARTLAHRLPPREYPKRKQRKHIQSRDGLRLTHTDMEHVNIPKGKQEKHIHNKDNLRLAQTNMKHGK